MTDQEVFEKVTRHLLSQNERSIGDTGCAYRGSDGLMCAVGCLIPDELYHPGMENVPIKYLIEAIPQLKELFCGVNLRLLSGLQSIHDFAVPENWRESLQNIAKDVNLTFPEGV